ncbi:hypothetical protein K503DRAFT_806302 [Rhizopogon vinicolor AM-OR11-026]|uniref:Uncharacterized protein n=1 Tax=Rhizopogon vinicolor AM-OR11-026 TaxID=1314800 RepID=A0A1B7MF04_9AGAM|nr:hypothetical protein K503DRAFT_806302 [Rhizopogon vinicolor AM-OR11-026]
MSSLLLIDSLERWRSDGSNHQFIHTGSLDEVCYQKASEEEERPSHGFFLSVSEANVLFSRTCKHLRMNRGDACSIRQGCSYIVHLFPSIFIVPLRRTEPSVQFSLGLEP